MIRALALILLLLGTAPALAAAAFVQSKCDDPASPASDSITLTNAVAAGDLITVFIRISSTTDELSTVTDNQSGTYTRNFTQPETTNAFTLYALYRPNAASGTLTVSETESVSTAIRWCVVEWSGVATSTPVDVVASKDNSTSSTSQIGPSITTTNASDLVMTVIATGNNQNETITDSAGWTKNWSGNASNGFLILQGSSQNAAFTGNFQDTYTISSADAVGTGALAFKTAAPNCKQQLGALGAGC